MQELILYLIKSGISLVLLYSVFWLFLSRDTFFRLNRAYLVTSVIFSLLFPLLPVTITVGDVAPTYTVMLDTIVINASRVEPAVVNNLGMFQVLTIVYLTGMSIFVLRFLFQIGQLILMVRRYGITRHEGMNIIFVDQNYAPFSFFGLIFINRKKLDEEQVQEIIDHEKVHIRQRHSWDLIIFEILTIVQWFNPFVWFYRHSIKTVHEYLADEGVLLKGHSPVGYQQLLLEQSTGLQLNDLTNNFNHSLIKKRIIMMTKSKSTIIARLKLLVAMPVAFLLVVAFTASPTINMFGQSEMRIPDSIKEKLPEGVTIKEIKGRESGYTNNTPASGDIYTVTEIIPQFPGGRNMMMRYLASKIDYPDKARKEGIEGTVYVTFVVEKDGAISNAKVLRGFDEECDKVALDAVMSMPKWDPGREKGEPVRVQFNMPVKFALDSEEEIEKGGGSEKTPPSPPKEVEVIKLDESKQLPPPPPRKEKK